MSNRYAARTDQNQSAIVAALRAVGCSVVSLHRVGGGVPDLLVGHIGHTYLLEIKTPTGRVSPNQRAWHRAWDGDTVYVVRTPEEALRAVGLQVILKKPEK